MYLLKMPKADENMSAGTVVEWLVREGERIERGADAVVCLADKGEFRAWAEEPGLVLRIFAPEQSVVPVGYALAAIGEARELAPEAEAEIVRANESLVAGSRQELTADVSGAPGPASRVRATPGARRVARELGVDLAVVSAAVGGRMVCEEDVRAFASKGGLR